MLSSIVFYLVWTLPFVTGKLFGICPKEEIACLSKVTIGQIDYINERIREDLLSLVNTNFFKYFKIDMNKKCEFFDNKKESLCFSRSCTLNVVEDWGSLPEFWQPEVLGGFEKSSTEDVDTHSDECAFLDELCFREQNLYEVNDINYCDINDIMDNKNSVLIDLTQNPERFTGYGGNQSLQIWSSIYKENCFECNETEGCIAKEIFFKLISGFHSSITTHVCNYHLNTVSGNWEPNIFLFISSFLIFPDRIRNVYFNYALVSKAIMKIAPYMEHIEFCEDMDPSGDVKLKIEKIVSQLENDDIFNEEIVFQNKLTSELKTDFRNRFKNVTKIIDCIQCEKCKLWAKVQTTGYATSLKLLFELDQLSDSEKQNLVNKLTKYELIALFNTFNRLSSAIEAINKFGLMYEEEKTKSRRLLYGQELLGDISGSWKFLENFCFSLFS
ncbi:hypothetical protein KAFR_0L02120 [Kazachstania africana CBS 2517]|uniref:Endoplasmic oxidoreductin n=1 Tax=Kazachstania africana (strain ATCC 22294 / BCRC 22015 / CBS 2517 / CECT 1963 / NBRC 1671 / NRRL Y-8276) TaxID=1071382 RepID=H2B2H3_KAZAF|nr:hypothetical protein KAFR_0L02120 [Kazachstania africana CBS 2517]CCF60823.1 hypothetical protein KAFR_0L02120 [Kazachstania africana CBS 2517]